MPQISITSSAQNTLHRKGKANVVVVSGMLDPKPVVRLASAESGRGVLAEGAILSPAHRLLRRGWEGSQRSFPLTQWPFFPEERPWKAGHFHVAVASLLANLHATLHS